MQTQGIPTGFDGQIRRVGPGSHLQIDHAHPEMECNLVLRGQGAYILATGRLDLSAGVLVWHQPGHHHRLVRSSDLEMWVLIAHPDVVDEAFRKDVAGQPRRQLSGDDAVELDRLLTQVSQDADEPALFNAGLGYALRRARRASLDSAGQAREVLHPAVVKALLLLRRHADAPSIDEVARACGVTRPYLSRLLVQQTGRGFVEWRSRARLERFHLAYSRSGNLLSAALDAGFGSYAQFARVCRELTGSTPRDWVQGWSAAGPLPDAPKPGPETAHSPSGIDTLKARRPEPALPTLPSSYGVMPGLDGRRRLVWYALAGLMLPAVRHWWDGRILEHLLACDDPVLADPDTSAFVREPRHPSKALEEQLGALQDSDAALAAQLASVLQLHDLHSLYLNVAAAFGLGSDSVADVLTAYLAITWVTANQTVDPSVAQAQRLRAQVRHALASTAHPGLMTAAGRQELSDALILQFACTFSALMAARASGNAATQGMLADTVAGAIQGSLGWNIRAVRFGDLGFHEAKTHRS